MLGEAILGAGPGEHETNIACGELTRKTTEDDGFLSRSLARLQGHVTGAICIDTSMNLSCLLPSVSQGRPSESVGIYLKTGSSCKAKRTCLPTIPILADLRVLDRNKTISFSLRIVTSWFMLSHSLRQVLAWIPHLHR